jgi:hypothetical protein
MRFAPCWCAFEAMHLECNALTSDITVLHASQGKS